MKIIVAACGFAICAAALLAETPPAPSPAPESATDDNPGYVDDPGAQVLILNQLRDTMKDFVAADWKIEYLNTHKFQDDGVYMNLYRISNSRTGAVARVSVAIGFAKSEDDAGI
jgi:hypothetical protein